MTSLAADLLHQPLAPGDYVLNDQGKVFRVVETTTLLLDQANAVAAAPVRYARHGLVETPAPLYVRLTDLIKITDVEAATPRPELKLLFRTKYETVREERRATMRARHATTSNALRGDRTA
jgi:hypothetical protein